MNSFNRTRFTLFLLFSAVVQAATPLQSNLDEAAKLIRQARDTQNPADFREAGLMAAKALAAEPESFDAQRYQAMALLGEHDLDAALSVAAKLNLRVPDDIGIRAILSEIYVARGDYDDAERAAQWVLDLRRNSALGFSTAARLREIYGDYEGALEFYSEALRRTSPSDTQECSWLLVQSARMLLRMKNAAGAASTIDQAGKLFPNSVQVAKVRAEIAGAQGAPGIQ